MSAPKLIYKQNLRSLRSSLPRQPGGRRWRRGRGCAWQDWVYLLHLAGSRGGLGTAQVPSGPSPSPRLPTPKTRSILGGAGVAVVSGFPKPRTGLWTEPAGGLEVEAERWPGRPKGPRPAPPHTDPGEEDGEEWGLPTVP